MRFTPRGVHNEERGGARGVVGVFWILLAPPTGIEILYRTFGINKHLSEPQEYS